MKRVEAYHILGKMMNDCTVEQNEALTIAQNDIEFVDLVSDDMVCVVRCRECIYCEPRSKYLRCVRFGFTAGREVKPDDFCSYGERKEN